MTTPTMPIQGQVGQTIVSIILAMPIPGESDHEINMINALRNHIRDSLMGIPNNLPEIKGLQAKLPEAYDSEDDFDRLDRWCYNPPYFSPRSYPSASTPEPLAKPLPVLPSLPPSEPPKDVAMQLPTPVQPPVQPPVKPLIPIPWNIH